MHGSVNSLTFLFAVACLCKYHWSKI